MKDHTGSAFFAGLVIGGLVGAGLALLLAPQSGEETRAQIRDQSLMLKDRAEENVFEVRKHLEKQLAGLQEQVNSLQAQLQERSKEVIEKGQQAASDAYSRARGDN